MKRHAQLRGVVTKKKTADQRTERGGDGAEARPCADCAAALLLRERCADQREASRNEQRAADSLQRATEDELGDIARDAAPERRRGKDRDADDEYPAPPEAVAQCATNQQQRGQEQRK